MLFCVVYVLPHSPNIVEVGQIDQVALKCWALYQTDGRYVFHKPQILKHLLYMGMSHACQLVLCRIVDERGGRGGQHDAESILWL